MDCKTNHIFGKSSTFTCKQSNKRSGVRLVFSLTQMPWVSVRLAGFGCETLMLCQCFKLYKRKRLIWEKDQFFWSLYCKLVTFFSFRLRSLANVMGGRIPIPHQHPVEWTSLSPLLTWQTHAALVATPLVPTYHTYMTSQKMNLIDCCAW